jgi:short-subunit dehydrogenase
MPFDVKGGVALITGAASGIGAALAAALAKRGCNLALADIDGEGLAKTEKAVAAHGVKVSTHAVDVADADAILALPAEIKQRHGRLTVLVNNAGVALGGTFDQICLADFEWLMNINFWGPVRLTKAFLPMLKQEPAASIVNISSLFGIIAPPGQTAYCSSKFALRGFSESLRHELEGTPIRVTAVHPGGIATAIARNARIPKGVNPQEVALAIKRTEKMLTLSPDIAAGRIVAAIERGAPRLLIGKDAKTAEAIQRLFPATYFSFLRKAAGL